MGVEPACAISGLVNMRYREIREVKPPTPEAQRIKSLQTAAQRAKTALQQERKRQRLVRAQQALQRARLSES
jgi:hypothetical protein